MADTRLVLGVRVLASWPSISTSTRKLREGGKQARRNPRELGISELVGRVTRRVIVSIAMECRIRDHDGAIALAPKRPMIAPRDSGNRRGRLGSRTMDAALAPPIDISTLAEVNRNETS